MFPTLCVVIVIVNDDVWIGSGCRILSGVNIGHRVVVAAGAVVNKSITSNTIVAGVPAKVVKRAKKEKLVKNTHTKSALPQSDYVDGSIPFGASDVNIDVIDLTEEDDEDDTSVYNVESVLDIKEEKGVTIFLVKREGYKKATWEPKSGLIGEACEYHQAIPTQEPITCQISHVSFFDKNQWRKLRPWKR